MSKKDIIERNPFDSLWIIRAISVETESAILMGSKIRDNLKMTSSITGAIIATKRK
jgi:hypothetical protein